MSKTNTKTKTNTNTKTNTKIKPNTDTKIKPNTDTKTKPNANIKKYVDVDTDTETEVNTDETTESSNFQNSEFEDKDEKSSSDNTDEFEIFYGEKTLHNYITSNKKLTKKERLMKFIDMRMSLMDTYTQIDNTDFDFCRDYTKFECVDAYNYTRHIEWKKYYKNTPIKLIKLLKDVSWLPFFDSLNKNTIKYIENELKNEMKKGEIVPYPSLLFNSFNIVPAYKVKVVIIGQDPYPSITSIRGVNVPNATGLCFSAPRNITKPKSLINVYSNLHKYGHIKNIPNTGNLYMWALQGCLMINAALTTQCGKPGEHKVLWEIFTRELIAYLNNNFKNLVFLVWGSDAHNLTINVNPKRHKIIVSSHPSPLACNITLNGNKYSGECCNGKEEIQKDKKKKSFVVYPPYSKCDHFGDANNYLIDNGIIPILWDTIN
jgi:uracil-DNA glycosylase